ncbi:MAG: hypothetical protein ACKOTA_11935, partial [Solirubrobacterales bacterium]
MPDLPRGADRARGSGDRGSVVHQQPHARVALEGSLRLADVGQAGHPGLLDRKGRRVGQYQDEQTGGHFVESLSELKGNPDVWLSLQNGVHADSLGPSPITEWVEFLKIFVAGEVPDIPASIRGLSGELYRYLADAPALPVQQSRMAGLANVGEAKAAFQRYPRVRLLMD